MSYSCASNTIHTNNSGSLSEQVNRISLEIAEKWKGFNETGLLGGRSGMVLLFAYLSKLFPEKNLTGDLNNYLNDLCESLTSEELTHNLSGGVAGIAFVFQHLRNMNVLDTADALDFSEMDEFIKLAVDSDSKTGNWDPLHGMTGLGIYFLERNKETGERKYLEKIVDRLADMCANADGRRVWITPGNKNYNDNYNFGLAHGMPGVLSFLARVYSRGIKQHEISEMIVSSLAFLLDHEYSDDPLYSFPAALPVFQGVKQNKSLPRLAWCYGDLSMANTLVHCGKALNRRDWYEKGISVAVKTTHRTLENSGCIDATFCHGTVGLAHQYHRLYQITGNRIFEKARDYWLNMTQEHFYKPGQEAGGYHAGVYSEKTGEFEFVPKYGLLEGSMGIALVYLSILYDIKPGWDIIFMTDV
jgi:lantibiotic biosynthesis protein